MSFTEWIFNGFKDIHTPTLTLCFLLWGGIGQMVEKLKRLRWICYRPADIGGNSVTFAMISVIASCHQPKREA